MSHRTLRSSAVDPSIDIINARIQLEICQLAISELTDAQLLPIYMESKSVKAATRKLGAVLSKHCSPTLCSEILQEYIPHLIPAGTKGVFRGNRFNQIVKNCILSKYADDARFEVCFEKKSTLHPTDEIPDWYIVERKTNKILIGMNQLDLWSGGHQTNRASKYIISCKHNTETSKLVCVVCADVKLYSRKNKSFAIFEMGFKNNTLCYLGNLVGIITEYFGALH